ncbi:MAG: topoisomerase DNA-binding C4 zinc finger domain-containing protein, partial [Caulobacteraceae bacterium]|nr:topoisomerase DNA-binding C4 zinc finger domain-containing protein [Caulobacter sp.]
AFVGCSNYPECRYTRPFATGEAAEGEAPSGDRELGRDAATGRAVALKNGRFGWYVELTPEPGADAKEKPPRASLPKEWSVESLDLERGLRLLSLPREVGRHPEDGEPILAGLGRYGPYVQHGKTYASLDGIDDAFEVGLNRAVTLIAEKRAGGGARGRGAASQPLKALGAHPTRGDEMSVMPGRFGPYIKAGKLNVTIPKGTDPATLTLQAAAALVDAKAEAGGGAKPARGRKPAAAKAPAKQATQASAKKGAKAPAKARAKS